MQQLCDKLFLMFFTCVKNVQKQFMVVKAIKEMDVKGVQKSYPSNSDTIFKCTVHRSQLPMWKETRFRFSFIVLSDYFNCDWNVQSLSRSLLYVPMSIYSNWLVSKKCVCLLTPCIHIVILQMVHASEKSVFLNFRIHVPFAG